MNPLSSETLQLLWHDSEPREVRLRKIVTERLAANPPPVMDEHIVATYFFAFRTQTLDHAVQEISYHATIGVKDPPPGSLLAQCAAIPAGVDAFDGSGRLGLLHVAFPLKMMLQPDGACLTSCDILHTVAGMRSYSTYTRARTRDSSPCGSRIKSFALSPGPAYGPAGVRQASHRIFTDATRFRHDPETDRRHYAAASWLAR